MVAFLFIAELILLYLLSRRLIQTIYRLVFTILRSRTAAIWIATIIFFPGTVVHELSHLFVAEILGVRTGKLTLVPEGIQGPAFAKALGGESEIKAGGVMIAETDPLRRTLIGLAPVYVGVAVLAVISFFIRHSLAASQESVLKNALVSSLYFYLHFAVSNSMFSSKEDMKGVIPFTITVGLFAAAGFAAGFRFSLTGQLLTGLNLVIETLVRSLGVVLGVNLVVVAATSLLLKLFRRFR